MLVLALDCTDGRLATMIRLIKMFLQLLQIIIPITLILLGSVDFGRAVMASDEGAIKKAQKKFITRCIAAVLVFFSAMIVRFAMGFVGNTAWQACWDDVSTEKSTVCKYVADGISFQIKYTDTEIKIVPGSSINCDVNPFSFNETHFKTGCQPVVYVKVVTTSATPTKQCIFSLTNYSGGYTKAVLTDK